MMFISWFDEQRGRYAAYKLFGSQDSTSLQLRLLRTTGEAYFADTAERWNYLDALLKLVSNFLPRRNDIAHGELAVQNERARLFQPPFKVSHKDGTRGLGGYSLDAAHIKQYREHFIHLAREVVIATQQLAAPDAPTALPAWPQTPLSQYVEPQCTRLREKLIPTLPP